MSDESLVRGAPRQISAAPLITHHPSLLSHHSSVIPHHVAPLLALRPLPHHILGRPIVVKHVPHPKVLPHGSKSEHRSAPRRVPRDGPQRPAAAPHPAHPAPGPAAPGRGPGRTRRQ